MLSIAYIFSFDLPVLYINFISTGTLGYVMSEVEDGKPLSQVVKSAKCLGYTEPGIYKNKFAVFSLCMIRLLPLKVWIFYSTHVIL